MPILEVRGLVKFYTRRERYQRTEIVLEQFGLTRLKKNNAARLSGGEKRRLEIARCLVCEPLLVLLDEPFTGIDPKTIADIQHIVRDLRASGIGILLTDHHVREALKITDRSYLIKDGQVRTHGTPRQIIHDPIAISEYLGNSFNDDGLTGPAPDSAAPAPASAPPSAPPQPALHLVVEQEKIHRLIKDLRGAEHDRAAADLRQRGHAAVPALIDALERRDGEMRRQAFEVLQRLLDGAVFDPYAPEVHRRQQIALLREKTVRKAG